MIGVYTYQLTWLLCNDIYPMYLIGVDNMKTTKKMVAKVNKLEAENRRLKELLIHAGIDAWHVPDPILQSKFDNIMDKAKVDQGIM